MTNKHLSIVAALLISTASFAQKDEMKALKKIYDKETPTQKDIIDYRAEIAKAAPLMGNASASDKIYFDFYKSSAPIVEMSTAEAMANPAAAMKKIRVADIKAFAASASAVLEYEKTADKKLYTADIKETVGFMKPMMLQYAVNLVEAKKPAEAAQVLYATYQLDKSDADNLYYAANYALEANDNETALKYFYELRDINYSGEGVAYYATSLTNDQEQSFATEADMNKMIALKTHIKPRKENKPSKRGEIYKTIALILVSQGKTDEAKTAIVKARTENPEDTSLMLTEADLYLKLNDMPNYKRIITEVLQKNPNDAVLTYNLGVVSLNAGQTEEAEKYFLRAIELDANSANSYINYAAIKLQNDQKLVDQMNKLGTSTADNKKYDAFKAERNKLFKNVLPYLEKAYKLQPDNESVADNLMSVYNYLEMKPQYEELKAKRK